MNEPEKFPMGKVVYDLVYKATEGKCPLGGNKPMDRWDQLDDKHKERWNIVAEDTLFTSV